MIDWKQQRVWLGLLTLAVIIGSASAPLLTLAQQDATKKLTALRQATDKNTTALHQLQDDIAATEKLKSQIDAKTVEQSLLPVDRLRTAQIMEHRAAESHLTHFSYTLSPEEKTVIDTVGAGKQTLATTKLILAADAPTDTDAYQFLETLRRDLPGRLTLKEIELQRIGDTITDKNLRLTANGDWLSNGAKTDLTEGGK